MRALTVATLGGLLLAGQLWMQARATREHEASLAALQEAITKLGERPPVATIGSPAYVAARAVACASEAKTAGPAAATAPTGSSPTRLEPAPRTYEQQRALDSATQLLDAAIARGQLNAVDVEALHSEIRAAASPDETRQLMLRLAVAVNTNKIILEPGTLLF